MKIFVFISILIMFLGMSVPSFSKDKGKASPETLDNLKFIEGNEQENEKRALQTELLVAASERKAMEQLQLLLKKHRGTYIEADLWFRMAELYMRKSKTERFFELNRESDTVVKLAPKKVKSASSKREIIKAVGIYEKIQKQFKSFDKMDLVIFNNAFARQTLGQDKLAARLYNDLISMFPRSSLVPDAHLAIGEIKFDSNDFNTALKHFLSIEKYPSSRVYPYGMYKAAWTYYNLRKEPLGLEKLEQVVAFGRMVQEKGIDSRLDLRKEALADMTLFYEDVYLSKDAYSYFSKQAGDLDVTPTLLKLSFLYERHSRYEDKLAVLTALVKKQPYS
ncbi:MAG: adventurous gliding motility protein U, partial [Bdellovibrionales bacterium]|nr:adventurous gliding motility protein U [Bdellovibrionales bacterium]